MVDKILKIRCVENETENLPNVSAILGNTKEGVVESAVREFCE